MIANCIFVLGCWSDKRNNLNFGENLTGIFQYSVTFHKPNDSLKKHIYHIIKRMYNSCRALEAVADNSFGYGSQVIESAVQ